MHRRRKSNAAAAFVPCARISDLEPLPERQSREKLAVALIYSRFYNSADTGPAVL
jgi:hypothetical protein